MYPNIFKMRYAKVPAVIHVASRAVITTIGSIECDHSDVMAVRGAGVGMLSSASNQDCHDLAAVAHIAAIKGQIPFVHFYDGFRTSHQITNVELLEYDEMKELIPHKELEDFRKRAFNPNHPSLRLLAIDSSFHFQVDTAASFAHKKLPDIVEESMNKVAKITGRPLKIFDYYGHPQAESVILIMGSSSQNVKEAVDYLNAKGSKYGMIVVRLFRPFSTKHLLQAIPKSAKVITVLDRNHETGANAQVLHSDVCTALSVEQHPIRVIGGMYGIGGRELTPSQAGEVFKNSLKSNPRNLFRIGIEDDIGHTSLPVPKEIDMVPEGTKQCIFWGLGSDGTVGSNKEAIKIICDETKLFGQGYFTYDAKKSGGITRSHLRFGNQPITSNYAIKNADYIAVHCTNFTKVYQVCNELKERGTFVYNCPATNVKELENYIPTSLRKQLYDKRAQLYIIDATKISMEAGIPGRINMIMQAIFFKLSNVLDVDLAIRLLKKSVHKTYGQYGDKIVKANLAAIDAATSKVKKIDIPEEWGTFSPVPKSRFENVEATELMKRSIFPIFELRGNEMKPSDFLDIYSGIPTSGLGSSKYEKRGIATNIPVWDETKCVQCNSCSIGCAHAVIRPYLFKSGTAKDVKSIKSKVLKGYDFAIGISSYDCLGCGVCIRRCPAKALSFPAVTDELFKSVDEERKKLEALPDIDEVIEKDEVAGKKLNDRKFTADGSQYFKPLLEYSGACGGCHETLYAKMLSQLFGPRLMIANATGCSIVWSGSFPSQPWTVNSRGQGPTWGNSLFEDNAEYGLGIYTAFTHRRFELREKVLKALKTEKIEPDLKALLEEWIDVYSIGEKTLPLSNKLQDMLKDRHYPQGTLLHEIKNNADLFIKPSTWIIGGDGWANDIGFAGLDHVVASGADVNILIYDNEAYANTGFQMSKGTPRSAVLKFAATGKDKPKKDLTAMMMQYPNAYVAQCAIAADPRQTIRAMKEADAYGGSAFLDCYCPCIGHGISPSLAGGHNQAKLAVESAYWPLFRRDPLADKKFVLDHKVKKDEALSEFLKHESRYESLRRSDPERQKMLQSQLADDINRRWNSLVKLANE
jgi:pyruvate-ferredoxin/flavodoxin oxidoreductase